MDKNWAYIKNLINNNAIDEIVEICKQMETCEFQVIKNNLIQELGNTDIANHRNTIAIVLSDLKCDEAVETLVKSILDPKNRNNRGTLIYALKELKCESIIKNLIHVLFNGNFEVKWNMYDLLSKKIKYMSKSDQLECMNIIREEKERVLDELDLLEDVESNIFGMGE